MPVRCVSTVAIICTRSKLRNISLWCNANWIGLQCALSLQLCKSNVLTTFQNIFNHSVYGYFSMFIVIACNWCGYAYSNHFHYKPFITLWFWTLQSSLAFICVTQSMRCNAVLDLLSTWCSNAAVSWFSDGLRIEAAYDQSCLGSLYCIFACVARTKISKNVTVKWGCGLYAHFALKCGFTVTRAALLWSHASRRGCLPCKVSLSSLLSLHPCVLKLPSFMVA